MKNLALLSLLAILVMACSGSTSGKLDRLTTVSNTEISYIVLHPEEFGKDKEVTVKGKVVESTKIPILGSTLVLEDAQGERIAVSLKDGSNVPSEGAEFVVTGYVEQGSKFNIAGYEHNGLVLKQKEQVTFTEK